MRNSFHKIRAAFALVALLALLAIPGINVAANVKEVYLGGMPAGFTMGLGGAQVVGVCEILTEDGTACPAKQAGLSVGDIILSYGGIRILSAADIDGALAAKGGVCAEITLRRGDEEQKKQISPVKDAVCGKFKLRSRHIVVRRIRLVAVQFRDVFHQSIVIGQILDAVQTKSFQKIIRCRI